MHNKKVALTKVDSKFSKDQDKMATTSINICDASLNQI